AAGIVRVAKHPVLRGGAGIQVFTGGDGAVELLGEVAPGVVGINVGPVRLVLGCGQAVQRVIGEGLRTRGVFDVGDGENVSVVASRGSIRILLVNERTRIGRRAGPDLGGLEPAVVINVVLVIVEIRAQELLHGTASQQSRRSRLSID